MDPLCAFFTAHLIEIYFLYGLAFFITGVVVWLEAGRSSALPLARALPYLAAFGLIHGGHEWWEMFQLMAPGTPTMLLRGLRILVLAGSFALLVEFGLRLLVLNGRRRWLMVRWVVLAVFLLGQGLIWATWGADPEMWLAAADAWTRYSMAVPGAVLAAAGLLRQGRHPASRETGVSRHLLIVGMAFLLYGVPGQVFVGQSPLPPSTVLNSALFMQTLHFPVQLLRTVMAGGVVTFILRAGRRFELQRQRQMEELGQARAEAQRRLNEEMAERERMRKELLHQTVQAQERERQHVARELHDEAGQALTAVAWKLAAVEEVLADRPEEARGGIRELRQLTERVMADLHQLTTRLRPAVLDELGLVPALIKYADDCSAGFPFVVEVEVTGRRRRLAPHVETTLYRITQEAITNVAKHAEATRAAIRLHFGERELVLSVSDNGRGMDVEAARRAAASGKGWGLAGVYERVGLVGGQMDIQSLPGSGTEIIVRVPVPMEESPREADSVAAGG